MELKSIQTTVPITIFLRGTMRLKVTLSGAFCTLKCFLTWKALLQRSTEMKNILLDQYKKFFISGCKLHATVP